MTGASSVFDRAKKTQAKNDLTQIVTAVNAYYTEYGNYPSTTTPEMTYDGTAGKTNNLLFDALRAVNTTVNTRGIVFISPRFAVGTTGTPRAHQPSARDERPICAIMANPTSSGLIPTSITLSPTRIRPTRGRFL